MSVNSIDLREIIKDFSNRGLLIETNVDDNIPVSYVTYDSRNVKNGTLFVCKGAHFLCDYLINAISEGAVAYVSEKKYELSSDVPYIIVKNIREAMPIISKKIYGDLSKQINMIGITGTKGKSTITYYLKYIFDEYLNAINKSKIAICSGIKNYDGIIEEVSNLTTPENFSLYEHMNNAIHSNIKYMAMEVSSQALKYNRVDGISYEMCCFNNIGNDHISPNEHKDFDDYFRSKLKIFSQSKKACINLDSEHISEILDAAKNNEVITYSLNNSKANVIARNVYSKDGKVSFSVEVRGIRGLEKAEAEIMLRSIGTVNVGNALAAIAISLSFGVPFPYIKMALLKAEVPGRMQLLHSKDGRKLAVVDYAHNKLSLETLLSALIKEFPSKDIVIAFGSTGDKAYNRREEMGITASKFCKHIILTEDDCGSESVKEICDEIASYIHGNCTYEIIEDRPTAIRKLLSYSNEGTIIVAAGKADETLQKRKGCSVKIESDVEIIKRNFAVFDNK